MSFTPYPDSPAPATPPVGYTEDPDRPVPPRDPMTVIEAITSELFVWAEPPKWWAVAAEPAGVHQEIGAAVDEANSYDSAEPEEGRALVAFARGS